MTANSTTRRALAAVAALSLAVTLAGTAAGPADGGRRRLPGREPDRPGGAAPRPGADNAAHRGRSIIDGGDTVVTTLPGRLQILGRVRVQLHRPRPATTTAAQTLWRVRTDGSALRLRDLDDRTGEEMRLGSYGYRIAYTRDLPGRPFRTRLFVVRSSDGSLVGTRLLRGHVEVRRLRGEGAAHRDPAGADPVVPREQG